MPTRRISYVSCRMKRDTYSKVIVTFNSIYYIRYRNAITLTLHYGAKLQVKTNR